MSPAVVQIINNPHKVPLFESCKEFETAFTNKAIPEEIPRMSKIAPRSNTIELIATNLLRDANDKFTGWAAHPSNPVKRLVMPLNQRVTLLI